MATQRLWRLAIGGTALGALLMLGGQLMGAELGALARGYGLLIVLAGVYLVAGLVLRHVLAQLPQRSGTPRSAVGRSASSEPLR